MEDQLSSQRPFQPACKQTAKHGEYIEVPKIVLVMPISWSWRELINSISWNYPKLFRKRSYIIPSLLREAV